MTKLTAAERKEIQAVLERNQASNIEFYRQYAPCPATDKMAEDIIMGEMLMAFNAAAIAREAAPAQEPPVHGSPRSTPKPNGP